MNIIDAAQRQSETTVQQANDEPPQFRLVNWMPFPWDVIGWVDAACGDLIIEGILICQVGVQVFALVKQPVGFDDRAWGALLDTSVVLARQADPDRFEGTTSMWEPGT